MSRFVNGVYAATVADMQSFSILDERSSRARKNKHELELCLIRARMTKEQRAKFWAAVDGVNYRLDRLATVRRKCGRSGWWSAS